MLRRDAQMESNARIAGKVEVEHPATGRRTTWNLGQVPKIVDLSAQHPLRQGGPRRPNLVLGSVE